jgi:isocitrate dehydrogenase
MHRAKLDRQEELHKFAQILEDATIQTMEQGTLTKDLAIVAYNRWDVKEGEHWVVTEKFMDKIDANFQK